MLIILFLTSCKKEDGAPLENLTTNHWLLTKASVSPAKTSGSTTSTDLFVLDPSTCLANDYTMSFKTDGQYFISSNGALCDMIAGSQPYTYTDSKLKLNATEVIVKTLTSKNFSYSYAAVENGTTYTYTYTFVNKK